MRPVFSTLIAASLALFTPQLAEACFSNPPLSRQVVAFADVIFEGSIKSISPKPSYIELTFDVQNTVRGDLPHNEVVIGWKDNFYFGGRDILISNFIQAFGETTRVAISTPQLASRFCEFKKGFGSVRDKNTGETVTQEVVRPVCNSPATSLISVTREKLAFVLSNGERCGSSYLYSVQRYEKMRDYHKNLAAFEKAIEGRTTSKRELFLDLVGKPEALPWTEFSPRVESIVSTLFREHSGFFIPELKTNAAWQASLIDFGVAMVSEESPVYKVKFRNDEASLMAYRESLRTEILKLLDYMEKDPEFRTRLLQAD